MSGWPMWAQSVVGLGVVLAIDAVIFAVVFWLSWIVDRRRKRHELHQRADPGVPGGAPSPIAAGTGPPGIHFPPGTSISGASITIPPGTYITGAGASLIHGCTIQSASLLPYFRLQFIGS